MEKINRGRLTISANIILTASLITRTFTFGFIMMLILIKVNNDILNEDVIKIVDMQMVAGMPLGTTVKAVVFSFIGVFFLELVTGIFGIWGVIGKKKRILAVNVLMSSIMIVVYLIYTVNLSIIYDKKTDLNDTLYNFTSAYQATTPNTKYYMAYSYWENTFPNFLKKLGCQNSYPEIYHCGSVYVQKLDTYLQMYIGIILMCIVCQIVTIIAAEYTFRKLEYKEKKPSLSENKYYLLLSLKHGIFRSLTIFIKENWNRSKVVVVSVLLKIVSLTAGVGVLGVGFTLLGDEFLNNSSLKHIFYKLQFDNYYFYDILVGLAAASVVLGTLTSTVAILGLVGSWKKSPILLVMSTALSLVLHIPRIIAIAFWIFFIAKINSGMKLQLSLQQSGYYHIGVVTEITKKWHDMIMTLQCCGVNNYTDIYYGQGLYFCCKNAHPRILDSDGSFLSSNTFDFFGGCGGYKTDTCADVILYKTEIFVGLFLAIVLLQIVLEIIGVVFVNKEYLMIVLTKRSDDYTGKALNLKCELLGKMLRGIKSFCVNNWKRSKITLVHFISLGSLFMCNLVVLCVAINIRYDKIFGNSDIQALFSRINVTDHTLTTAVSTFSIVTITFSSVSVAVVIFSMIVLVLPKLKYVFSFVSAGMLCITTIANLLEEGLWVAYFVNVSSELENELMKQFISYDGGYYRSESSALYSWSLSLSWNTLFVKAECCGVGPMNESSFVLTSWNKLSHNMGRKIPVQCCVSQTDVFPYSTMTDLNCTTSMLDGYYHTQSCDVAVKNILEAYSTVFIVFMAITIIAEICCIVTTVLNARRYKQEATILIRSIKTSGEDGELRKADKTPKVKDNEKKERKHGDKHDKVGKGSSRNKRQSFNLEENIELHMMKSMEIEDTVSDKPDKPTDKRRQEEDELIAKDLTVTGN